MQLAYRPASLAGWGGHLIDAVSGFGGTCHVELVFANGECLSSTLADGVRFTRRDLTGWIIEPLDVTAGEEAIVRVFGEREAGCPYDRWGMARFTLPFLKEHKSAWFCSEICVAGLQRINRLLCYDPWRVSPNKLRRLHKSPQYFTGYPAT